MQENDFPGWVSNALRSPVEQTYHGLNLVLELETPAKLPLMLWDIVLAQDKIKQALEELSFVHYARFIPSYDGRALMVTTEFDGPLEPYVLDFVIALGDVFDVLLSYVRSTPGQPVPVPVRDNPARFANWVRAHNRVPFFPLGLVADTRFPPDFDYPVYSAYPGRTVTDIAGGRTVLPQPALDHPAAVVDAGDVQGNILRGYGARHGRYLFFSVSDAARARNWLATVLPRAGTPWGGIGAESGWTGAPPPVLTQVAFTHEGLKALLPGDTGALGSFPKAFRDGAVRRAAENGDTGASRPENWLFGGPADPVHVVLFVYTKADGPPAAFATAVDELQRAPGAGLQWLRTMDGVRLPEPDQPGSRFGAEPFGFVDGLSDPPISGQCPGPEPAWQPAASPGEFLLHKDYKSIYGGPSLGGMPEHLARNGSFGALRLLEQDVAGFHAATDAEAVRLRIAPALLRAKLVGRWPDGTPLALSPDAPDGPNSKTNAFDYAPSWEFPDVPDDHVGLRCPVGAHVRRSNPRTARVAGQRHSHRLLRRGMVSRWSDAGTPREGLMGLFMGADLERQFEFVQRQWLQGDLAASGVRGTTDPIAAIRAGDTDFHFLMPDPLCAHAPPVRLTARIPPLVRTRGCLYLFFPGLAALRNLDVPVAAVPAAPPPADPPPPPAPTRDGRLLAVIETVVGAAHGFVDEVAHAAEDLQHRVGGVLVGDLLRLPPDPQVLRGIGVLDDLVGSPWRDFMQALTDRDITSQIVKRFLDALSPPLPARPEQAPVGVYDAGREIDFEDPRFRAGPFRALAGLRDAGHRIVWVPAQRACWVLRHADCLDLLRRHADFVQVPAGTDYRGIVTLDRPRHAVVRTAYGAAFRAALDRLTRRRVIDDVIQARLALLPAGARRCHFDFMRDYAHPVARQVIWQLIGIDDAAEQARCDVLADKLVMRYGKTATPGPVGALVAADAGLRLAARLALPLSHAWLISPIPGNRYEGTLIGELAARMGAVLPSPHARVLTFVEVLVTLVQTVLASQSPHFLLGSAALHLMTPDASGATPWQALHGMRNSAQFGPALEKVLNETRRCEPPLTLVERYAQGAQQICGVEVPDGCAVFAMIASGNRDDLKFAPEPEQFRYDRPTHPDDLLSLGHGIHVCAGQELQAMLAPTALGAIVAAMGDLRLRNPAARPAWRSTVYFRVLQGLSVTCCPP